MSKERLIKLAERILKRTRFYQENRELGINSNENYQLLYVMAKGKNPIPEEVIAYAKYDDGIIYFYPLDKNASENAIYHWAFHLDTDLFWGLEQGYELVYMSMMGHFVTWGIIADCNERNVDIASKTGMQKYLAYCKKNKITKALLQQEFSYSSMDVMALYDKDFLKAVKPIKTHER